MFQIDKHILTKFSLDNSFSDNFQQTPKSIFSFHSFFLLFLTLLFSFLYHHLKRIAQWSSQILRFTFIHSPPSTLKSKLIDLRFTIYTRKNVAGWDDRSQDTIIDTKYRISSIHVLVHTRRDDKTSVEGRENRMNRLACGTGAGTTDPCKLH